MAMTKALSSRELIRMLEAEGWTYRKSTGDHRHYVPPDKPGKVTVTHPVDTIPIGTLRSIYRQAGWDWGQRR
ncbi:addiction module toxin, HicA family protein [Aureimonas glaciei]|uniref:Addiction module toxin, HicA family protein n=2 Tax=Aureimonas glaciei TaxID=1776957 RepID=A0A916XVR5_9HYPH|nr:addiction module toxin, HicA family protein [Aureimonas glaciei]